MDQKSTWSLRKVAAVLYPLVVITGAILLFPVMNSLAGSIRNLPITQFQPGKVFLALGHSTAISFPSKPERLVLGAPNRVAVDFLGNDVTVTPLAQNPGNLIVYTKSGRYVLLFELGSAAKYDDVVNIRYGAVAQPLKLMDDSFHAVKFQIEFKAKKKSEKNSSIDTTGILSGSERRLDGDDFAAALKSIKQLRCQGCTISTRDGFQLYCIKPVTELKCDAALYSIKIKRNE